MSARSIFILVYVNIHILNYIDIHIDFLVVERISIEYTVYTYTR